MYEIRFPYPVTCVADSGPMWYLCIAIAMSRTSRPEMYELDFVDMSVIQLIFEGLLHSLHRGLFIWEICHYDEPNHL